MKFGRIPDIRPDRIPGKKIARYPAAGNVVVVVVHLRPPWVMGMRRIKLRKSTGYVLCSVKSCFKRTNFNMLTERADELHVVKTSVHNVIKY